MACVFRSLQDMATANGAQPMSNPRWHSLATDFAQMLRAETPPDRALVGATVFTEISVAQWLEQSCWRPIRVFCLVELAQRYCLWW